MDDEGLTSSSDEEPISAAPGSDDAASSSNRTQTLRTNCNNRDLNEKILKLERENFQLKLRIHLNETKGSVVEPRGFVNSHPKNNSRDSALEEEISSLKQDKQKLEYQLQQTENKLEAETKIKENLLEKEATVLNKFTQLRHYATTLERKLVQLQRQGPSQLYSPDGRPALLRSHPISALSASLSFTAANNNNGDDFSFETSTPIPKLLADEPVAQYEQGLQNLARLQAEYEATKRDFELVLEERNGLVAQLRGMEQSYTSYQRDTEIKYGTMIDRLTEDNQKLQKLNTQLELSLRQAQDRTVALSNAAKFEMANQLKIHQSALEKVHREQAILISELQALKKMSICSPSGLIKSIGELEKYTRPATAPTSSPTKTLIPRSTTSAVPLKLKEKQTSNVGDGVEDGIFQVEPPAEDQLRRVRSSESSLGGGFRYENNIELMNKNLREKNSKLAIKLANTRNSLKKAIELLEHSEKDKEGMEKVICRQLHRTHKILSEVRETLSNPKSGEEEGSKNPMILNPLRVNENPGDVTKL